MKRIPPSSTKSKTKSLSSKRKQVSSKSSVRKVPARPTRQAVSGSTRRSVLDPAKSKQSQLIALMRSAPGASMTALTALTGWKPHTVRGTISGSLRKRLGLNVQCLVENGVRVYRIVEHSAS